MPDDRLSATFAALADPTRRAILARLALGEAAVGELAAPLAMSLPAPTASSSCAAASPPASAGRSRAATTRSCG